MKNFKGINLFSLTLAFQKIFTRKTDLPLIPSLARRGNFSPSRGIHVIHETIPAKSGLIVTINSGI